MNASTILSILQTISVILAIIIAVYTIRSNGNQKVVELIEMKSDIKHIKEKIDGINNIRDLARDAKSSAKAANKRIDEHLRNEHGKTIERRHENEE